MGSFARNQNRSWAAVAQDEVKSEIKASLVEAGIEDLIITDLWEYKNAPTGKLLVRKFYTEQEADELGLFVPMFGQASQEIEISDPFSIEWWGKWDEQKRLHAAQTAALEVEKGKRF